MSGTLATATITVRNGRHQGESIECAFNPSEYRVETHANYAETPTFGSGGSLVQFVDGDAETLSMELLFDTTDERADDVRTRYTDHLDRLLQVDDELNAPPVCRFVWGEGLDFTAVLERADKRFTKFQPSGVPVRARVQVTFLEYETNADRRSSVATGSTSDPERWTVTEGDTLWLIAQETYGDPGQWRPIARRNDVSNPRTLSPGETLEVPPL